MCFGVQESPGKQSDENFEQSDENFEQKKFDFLMIFELRNFEEMSFYIPEKWISSNFKVV